MGSHSFQQIVGYRNLKNWQTSWQRFSFRVTKDEALDLPDKIYTTREVVVQKNNTVLSLNQDSGYCFAR